MIWTDRGFTIIAGTPQAYFAGIWDETISGVESDDAGRPTAAGIYLAGIKTQAGYLGSKIYRLK